MIDRRSYWSTQNFHVGGLDHGAETFRSWREFRNYDWTIVDSDWSENLICGWFMEILEDDRPDVADEYQLIVYVIAPKKGRFIPLVVQNLTDADAPEIVKFIADVARKQAEHWSIKTENV